MDSTRCWSNHVPLYEYQCDACGCRFEVIQKFSDSAVETCKECGKGPVRRLPSSPAIQFKGTGWYITDYAQKGKSDSSAGAPAKSDTAKADTTTTDSKQSKSDAAKSDTSSSASSTAKESKG
jgi:putative regulatory protein, FmdB family